MNREENTALSFSLFAKSTKGAVREGKSKDREKEASPKGTREKPEAGRQPGQGHPILLN